MDFSYFNNITNFRPAKPYAEILDNADWYNADKIRKKFKDWDFSPAGRKRQMKRMQDYTRKSVAKGRYGIADFICPTNELQEAFMADYVIFMDTVEKSKYEDTDKIFQKPSEKGFGVTLKAVPVSGFKLVANTFAPGNTAPDPLRINSESGES